MNDKPTKSFSLGVWLLGRMLNRRKNYGLFGDMEELYNLKIAEKGRLKASFWIWMQILRVIPAYFQDSIYWNAVMFNSYLKITLRNFKRQKAYSLINVLGLSVGMACCILILAYVHMELSYDRYHTQASRIYRLAIDGELTGRDFNIACTNNPPGPYLAENFPEVENSARVRPRSRAQVSIEDKDFFSGGIIYADASVFDIFDFPLISGDKNTALKNPYTAVLTESTAQRFFRDKNPVGKIIRLDNQTDYTITGVIKDVPVNSHFTFHVMLSFATRYAQNRAQLEQWMGDFDNYTYLLLREGVDPKALEQKFPPIVEEKMGDIVKSVGGHIEYILQPLTSIHLHSHLDGEISANSDITYVYIFSAVALFILFLACINFMNLATARSANRAREVGMRKVHGAVKMKLVRQFLGEALIYCFAALILALILVEAMLPLFNSISGRNLNINYFGIPWLIPALIMLALFVSLIAGSYPAFYLSGFHPASVLKGNFGQARSKSRLRSLLVVFQFTVSTMLIIGTAVIYNQLNFMKNKRLGFEKEQVIVIPVNNENLRDALPAIKQEFKMLPEVLNVTMASHSPSWGARRNVCLPEGFTLDDSQMMAIITVDHDFLPTLGIDLSAGRNFSPEYPSDPSQAVLINETAARKFGWDDPLGKKIRELDGRLITKTVVGVVKDYHFISVRYIIEPMLISNSAENYESLSIRLAPGETPEALEKMRNKWGEIAPNTPFDYFFLGSEYNSLYQAEERLTRIFTYFSLLAIFIACLGLFGMAAYSAEQRTKELGIRKVLGASISKLVLLLTKEFTLLVTIANLIAWPLVFLYARRWLQDFPYRVDMSIWIFIGTALLIFLIGLLTISYQSFKAALANPSDSLKYE